MDKTLSVNVTSFEDTQVVAIVGNRPHLSKENYFRGFCFEFLNLAKDKDISWGQVRVLLAALALMEFENILQVSQEEIAAVLGVARPRVSEAMKVLVAKGYVEVRGQVGRQNIYAVSPHLAFKSRAKNLRYLRQAWIEGKTPQTTRRAIGAVDIEISEHELSPIEDLSKRFDIPTKKLEALMEFLGGGSNE